MSNNKDNSEQREVLTGAVERVRAIAEWHARAIRPHEPTDPDDKGGLGKEDVDALVDDVGFLLAYTQYLEGTLVDVSRTLKVMTGGQLDRAREAMNERAR